MDAGLLFVSYVGIPSSRGAFPRFSIPTACSTTASNGGGSRSAGLRVDNGLSFTGFPKRLAPYSCHLSDAASGSVKVIPFFLYLCLLDSLERFFIDFTLHVGSCISKPIVDSSICAHSFLAGHFV